MLELADTRGTVEALAKVLAKRGVGWFQPGDEDTRTGEMSAPPIFINHVPAEPTEVIVLRAYQVITPPNPSLFTREIMVQARVRARRDATTLVESIVGAISRGNHVIGDRVACYAESIVPIGADAHGRDETTVNIKIITGGK